MPKEKKDPSSAKTTEGKKKVKSSGKGEKFADMSAGPVIEEPVLAEDVGTQRAAPALKEPRVRGKKYQDVKKMVDPNKTYSIKEAFELLKKISFGKNPSTVEAHFNVLEKGLSGEVNLPFSAGKTRKVVIFSPELAEEIKAGKINFDVLLAAPTDMPKILPLAKVLGPKGLMPSPKSNTLVPDPQKALANFPASAAAYKTEKDFPLIHTVIGKLNQPAEELQANFEALVKAINSKNIKKAILKSTMSPGIKIAL